MLIRAARNVGLHGAGGHSYPGLLQGDTKRETMQLRLSGEKNGHYSNEQKKRKKGKKKKKKKNKEGKKERDD